MNELDVKRVLQQAIDTYGVEAQLDMCIEEMSELTKAICKYKRLQNSISENKYVARTEMLDFTSKLSTATDNIAEETADVLIMLEQIKMIFGTSTIEKQIDYKVKRLAERLGMSDETN